MKSNKNRKKLWGVLLLFLVLFVLHFSKLSKPLEGWVLNKILRFQSSVYNISLEISQRFSKSKTLKELREENTKLNEEVADLNYQIASLEHLKKENSDLRDILNYQPANNYQRLVAEVIGVDPKINNTLLINKGKKDGVLEGNAVIVGQGNIIGRIIKSKENISTVLLVTDNQLKLPVTKVDQDKALGVAQGDFGLSVVVDLIPQSEDLVEGDLLVTSSLEPTLPSGLVVGRVNRIISEDNDLFKKATILPLVDFEDIRLVAVLVEDL